MHLTHAKYCGWQGYKTDNPSFPHPKGPELERATDANNTMF